MADAYNFEGHQIPHVGVKGVTVGGVAAQGREFDARISNFGALVGGLRSTADYTTTSKGFKDKGELENPRITEDMSDAAFNYNPLIWGGTLKYTRNDELRIMGMGARIGDSSHDAPNADVMDTNLADDDGTNAPKQMPAEGWHTFGGRKGGPFGWVTPGYQPR